MTVSWEWSLELLVPNALLDAEGNALLDAEGNALLDSGEWSAINEDVRVFDHDVVMTRGIEGNDVESRVAVPGTVTFYLDNSEANSGGLLGYYSPDHANCRAGFDKGALVRLRVSSGGTERYVYRGKVNEIDPTPGQFKKRQVMVQCVDFMQEFIEHKLSGIAVQIDKRPDELVNTVLGNMVNSPQNSSIATDTITFSYGLHSEQDERSTAMTALTKICRTALGYAFIRGDSTSGETFVYQMRYDRSSAGTAATFDNTMSDLLVTRSNKNFFNKVIGMINPVNIDSGADTLLSSLVDELAIDAGNTETIRLQYRDPNGAATRVSGINIVTTLVADTHYKFSSTSGDGGNDMNADLSAVVTAGGNSVSIALTNNGGTRGYLNKLDIYGDGVYLYDPIEVVVESGNADRVLTYNLFYQDDYYTGRDFVSSIHSRVSSEESDVKKMSFFADANSTLMGYALSVDIGSRIWITEAATGVDDAFFVNQMTMRIKKDGRLQVDYLLERDASIFYFILGTDQLDDTSVFLGS